MFISKILLYQDPNSVGDPHHDLPLAHHLQVGVYVDINPPPLVQFHYPLYFSAGKMKIVFLPTYQHGNLLAALLRVDFRMRETKFA